MVLKERVTQTLDECHSVENCHARDKSFKVWKVIAWSPGTAQTIKRNGKEIFVNCHSRPPITENKSRAPHVEVFVVKITRGLVADILS